MFDSKPIIKITNHLNSLSPGERGDDISKLDDVKYFRAIEKYSLRGNLKDHLIENGTNFWDYSDKKCKYHRHDTGQAWSIGEKIIRKHLGKTLEEIKEIMLKKRKPYFIEQGFLDLLDYIRDDKDEEFTINSENKVELRVKKITVKPEFNPYLYRRFNFNNPHCTSLPLQERYEKILEVLDRKGYLLEISELDTVIRGKGVVVYISIDPSSPYCGLIVADYFEFFNKVSRCPVSFEIPKSFLGCQSAIKELEFLGSEKAKKELINDNYEMKHVTRKFYYD